MGTSQMKATILLASVFGVAIFAPDANNTLGEGWAIHPFSIALTTMIIMFFWFMEDSDTPRNYNRRKGKEHKNR